MFLMNPTTVVYSASDLSSASSCEWATMRRLDAKLGRCEAPPDAADAMMLRAARLGDVHEERFLHTLRRTRQVVEIDRPDRSEIDTAAALTAEAFRSNAEVVYQAAFFDGRLLGYADFIVRQDVGVNEPRPFPTKADGQAAYEVYDTKLARKPKVTALLQLAAYSDQLERLGIPTGENVHLVLGTQHVSSHLLADILPVYRLRRDRLQRIIDERVGEASATEWGDSRYTACGRCAVCDEQVRLTRDVLLVAGLRLNQRAQLASSGIHSIEELARSTGDVPGLSESTVAHLRGQAGLQLTPATAETPLPWRVNDPVALSMLPLPSAGDIFFDFEGDPLFQEGSVWGLDYLFGLVEPDSTFHAFWAHDLAQERHALIEFLAWLRQRRKNYPDMHVYHYASYERTHLLTLAARHGVGEEEVDDLLRNTVLVDLYPIVRRGIGVGSRSYSLKKLEPLYMGEDARDGVATAADSISEYVRYRAELDAGNTAVAAEILASIADYNEYDCRSTLRLRDWLLARASECAVQPSAPSDLAPEIPLRDPSPVYLALVESISGVAPRDRSPDQTAIALASAAIDYHRREAKTFWWDHFSRLADPLDDWANTRDVFVIARAEVERDWYREGRQRKDRRQLRITGMPAPGSSFAADQQPFVVYDSAHATVPPSPRQATRSSAEGRIIEVVGEEEFLLEETIPGGALTDDEMPIALTPARPPNTESLVGSIAEWGQTVLDALPTLLPDPALDILRRLPPRLTGGELSAVVDGDTRAAIVDSLTRLDHSFLAVQGPPGTGKTFIGSRVIAELVAKFGWRIGVVAQSHATVEHMLGAVISAGVEAGRVGKKPKTGDKAVVPWTTLGPANQAAFLRQEGGSVIGGTAWTFSNANQVARAELDLLVIDEAGQFSLASTIASSVATTRLLLLGDPQQLPQVSQGTHPEPVDVSALGWLSDGHRVLPLTFGYFLETSWRMHPELCAPVSALSYEGKLHSHASDRHLDGVPPGLHPTPLRHIGNSTASIEEADEVVRLLRRLLGLAWHSGGSTSTLKASDVIVVAPYNAQVECIKDRLDRAGIAEVSVGTVDKFQGREAAVAIVSLSASSAEDVPRGLEFLLLANRLNVAISRAQWAAYLLYSPGLTESIPGSVTALAQLSAFVTLVAKRDLNESAAMPR